MRTLLPIEMFDDGSDNLPLRGRVRTEPSQLRKAVAELPVVGPDPMKLNVRVSFGPDREEHRIRLVAERNEVVRKVREKGQRGLRLAAQDPCDTPHRTLTREPAQG